MAAREFHGLIKNEWDEPLVHSNDFHIASSAWQDPWFPSKEPGAGLINPGETAEWRCESDGVVVGTQGWARWRIKVLDISSNQPEHSEFVQVNWNVPFFGTPDAQCVVFRSDPSENFPDPNPPVLEIVSVARDPDTGDPMWTGQDGGDPPLAEAAEMAPYTLLIPWSFPFKVEFVSKPVYGFIVRRRAGPVRSLLTFPTTLPTRQQMAMEDFRHRAKIASQSNFVGGFPNFYQAIHGLDHVGGTVFINHAAAEWRDVSLANLGNVSLEDFGARMRATQTYASQNGFIGGFPTFFHADYGSGIVCGTVLLKSDGAEWRDVPLSELGNPELDDFEARFRATQDYANRNGFVGGFPNLYHAQAIVGMDPRTGQRRYDTVCGTVLLKPGFAEWQDVFLSRDPA